MALDIPNLDPNDFMGPYSKAYRQSNALQNEILQRKMQEMQNAFYPRQTQAEIASKSAYSQFMAPQAAAKLLSNPALFEALNREQKEQLIKAASGLVMEPFSNQILNQPFPEQEQGLLGKLYSKFFGGGGAPQQMPSQPMQNMPSQGPMVTYDTPQGKVQIPAEKGNALATVNQPSGPPTFNAIQRVTSEGYQPKVYKGEEPENPAIAAKKKEFEAKAEARIKERNENKKNEYFQKEWHEQNKAMGEQLKAQDEFLSDLDILEENYKEAAPFEKGAFLGGKIKPITTAGQNAAAATNRMLAAAGRALNSGHITDKDFGIAQNLKPNMGLNEKSMQDAINYFRGLNYRVGERAKFDALAQDMGFKTHETNLMWNRYINEKPFYNAKNGQLISENLGDFDNYLTEDSLDKAKHYKIKIPKQKIVTSEKPQEVKMLNGRRVAKDEKGWHYV